MKEAMGDGEGQARWLTGSMADRGIGLCFKRWLSSSHRLAELLSTGWSEGSPRQLPLTQFTYSGSVSRRVMSTEA
jgi:hypothetical protein